MDVSFQQRKSSRCTILRRSNRMNATTFDHMLAGSARRTTRRAAVRALAGGLLGGLLAQRGLTSIRAAQPTDSDGDGLYDADETNVYGTNPSAYDSDGDGSGDG